MNSGTVCTVCKLLKSDNTKLITCKNCHISVHLSCCNISSKVLKRMKDGFYFCFPSCSETSESDCKDLRLPTIASVTSELKSTVSAEMNNMRVEIKTLTTAIESSQTFLSSKFDDIISEFHKLKKENELLKREIEMLKQSQICLKNNINKLDMYVDSAHKEESLNNLVFLGLPSMPNEDARQLITETSKAIGVKLSSESIVSVVRIGSTKSVNAIPPVRVKFRCNSVKQVLLEKKKQYGVLSSTKVNEKLTINCKPTKISIREDLTPFSLQLLRDVRALQHQLSLKFVWTGHGGSVLVRKREGCKVEVIKNQYDLKNLVRRYRTANIVAPDAS